MTLGQSDCGLRAGSVCIGCIFMQRKRNDMRGSTPRCKLCSCTGGREPLGVRGFAQVSGGCLEYDKLVCWH